MTTVVKICGLKTAEALETAIDCGADLVGFVFYPPSPRSLAPEAAAELAKRLRGRAQAVALVVDADDNLLDFIVATVKPDMLQLHGSETVARCREIRRRLGIPIMKAIKVETAGDAETALFYQGAVDLILFDAKAPRDLAGALPGGNGLAFDWTAIDDIKDQVDWMLSGGLTPATVARAIAATGATAVDVSSGVEAAPGVKETDLIRRFIAAAKTAKGSA